MAIYPAGEATIEAPGLESRQEKIPGTRYHLRTDYHRCRNRRTIRSLFPGPLFRDWKAWDVRSSVQGRSRCFHQAFKDVVVMNSYPDPVPNNPATPLGRGHQAVTVEAVVVRIYNSELLNLLMPKPSVIDMTASCPLALMVVLLAFVSPQRLHRRHRPKLQRLWPTYRTPWAAVALVRLNAR